MPGAVTPAATSPKATGPSFGFQAAGAAQSGAIAIIGASSSSSEARPVNPATLQAPSAIIGRPIDEIIGEWNAELETRSRAFVKHAHALADWDARILKSRHALLTLEEELRSALAGQEALERRLAMLETHQRGIHDALIGMEGEAERLYREEVPLLDDEGKERDALYEKAEFLGGVLAGLGEQLRSAIADVNDSAAIGLGDGSTPLAKATRILNSQLQALAQLDTRSDELESRLGALRQAESQANGT